MNSEQKQTVAVIGLGAMGMGIATTLVRAGFAVRGYDIAQQSMIRLHAAGGERASTPARAATGADVVIVVVVNAAQTQSVLYGDDGAVAAMRPGSVVMASSTVPAAFARELGERLAGDGMLMLDAPLSGGAAAAREGRLSIMASGDPAAFDRAAAVLEAISARLYRLGDEAGAGSSVKTINQLLAGVHIAVAAEAMALGIRAGIDPQTLFEVISNSAGSSWMFQNRVPHMLAGDYTPLSAVDIFVKDLGIVLDTGRELSFPLPLSASAHQLFLAARAAGHGAEDDAAVIKVFQALTGIELPTPESTS